MVMIELEAAQEKRPPPAKPRPSATFSSPFPTPTLQWARRKRLRCSNDLLGAAHRFPSPSAEDSPSPARDWQKPPIRPRTPRKDEGFEGDEQEKPKPEEEPKPADDGGRFLRSRAVGVGSCGGRKKKKVELWISLSREEIEEDYYSMTGCKLPRRPKKRPRSAPANLPLRLFPGSWLPNTITTEMYKVHEPAEARRR